MSRKPRSRAPSPHLGQMITILPAFASLLSFHFRSRASLELELVALRHLVIALRRQRPPVTSTSAADRASFMTFALIPESLRGAAGAPEHRRSSWRSNLACVCSGPLSTGSPLTFLTNRHGDHSLGQRAASSAAMSPPQKTWSRLLRRLKSRSNEAPSMILAAIKRLVYEGLGRSPKACASNARRCRAFPARAMMQTALRRSLNAGRRGPCHQLPTADNAPEQGATGRTGIARSNCRVAGPGRPKPCRRGGVAATVRPEPTDVARRHPHSGGSRRARAASGDRAGSRSDGRASTGSPIRCPSACGSTMCPS
jgi:hypothetical protein